MVTIQALQRGISDHTPLLVDSGEATHAGNKNVFPFKLAWFEREGFIELIAGHGLRPQEGGRISSDGKIRLALDAFPEGLG